MLQLVPGVLAPFLWNAQFPPWESADSHGFRRCYEPICWLQGLLLRCDGTNSKNERTLLHWEAYTSFQMENRRSKQRGALWIYFQQDRVEYATEQTFNDLAAMSSGVEKNTSSTSKVWSSSCVVKNNKNKQSSSPTFFIQCNVFLGKKITWPAVTLYVVTVLPPASTIPIQALPWNTGRVTKLNQERNKQTLFFP